MGVDNLCIKNILFRIVHKIMLYLDESLILLDYNYSKKE